MTKASDRVLWIAAVVGISAYFMPWLVNAKSAILTVGAYDLAEWVSLTPAARLNNPLLWQALLLRLPLVLWAGIIAFGMSEVRNKRWRMAAGLFVALAAIGLSPAVNFIGRVGEDINYRQQLILAVAAATIGALGLSGIGRRRAQWVVGALAAAGIAASVIGYSAAERLMRAYGLQPTVGLGVLLSVAAYGQLVVYVIAALLRKRRASRVNK